MQLINAVKIITFIFYFFLFPWCLLYRSAWTSSWRSRDRNRPCSVTIARQRSSIIGCSARGRRLTPPSSRIQRTWTWRSSWSTVRWAARKRSDYLLRLVLWDCVWTEVWDFVFDWISMREMSCSKLSVHDFSGIIIIIITTSCYTIIARSTITAHT